MFDPEKMAEAFVASAKEYVRRSITALAERLDGFEQRLAQVPAGKDGAPGTDGQPGKDGRDGSDGTPGADGVPGKDGVNGKDGEAGPRGENGKDGAQGPAGPAGDAGKDGQAGPAGKDGAPGLIGKEGPAGAQGEPGLDGRDGREGEKGRDALQIEVLDGIDATRSYPRSTFATHRGGMIRSFRTTDAIGESLEKAGWHVILEGIAEEAETIDGRTVERITTYTSGRKSVRVYKTKALEYGGVWKEGSCERGDVRTWAGSAWHCEAEKTTAKPGTNDDWKLMVKSGRDGKDGKDAPTSKTLRLG